MGHCYVHFAFLFTKYICPKLNVLVLNYFGSGKYLYVYLSTFKVLLSGSGKDDTVVCETVTGLGLIYLNLYYRVVNSSLTDTIWRTVIVSQSLRDPNTVLASSVTQRN